MDHIYSIMITVYERIINGKKGEWTLHSIYADGLEGGKRREKEYADNFKTKDNNRTTKTNYYLL